ncbi:MAG TPA: alpha/beta hydrolase [Alphaproteobacteria bacterium]|nr:alpha/beta hydrolase [Alphaproteobacteria bacterium]
MRIKKLRGLSAVGFHDFYYREWGNPKNPTIVMVHGLSRNSLDFELLGEFLKSDYHCIAVDMVGRGLSDFLPNSSLYTFAQYFSDITSLLNVLDKEEVTWLGTSMGGLLGIILAAQEKTPIKKLLLNDVSPYVPGEWILSIREKIGLKPAFATFEQAVKFVKQFYADFCLPDENGWIWQTNASIVKNQEGLFEISYDSKLSNLGHFDKNLTPRNFDVTLWPQWEKISCPIYLLYGKKSLLVNNDLIEKMKSTKPSLKVFGIENVGHAPAFYGEDFLKSCKDFFEL